MVHVISSVKTSAAALPAAATRIASARLASLDHWRAALASRTSSTAVQKPAAQTPTAAASPDTGSTTTAAAGTTATTAASTAPGGLAALFPGNPSCWATSAAPAPVPVPTAESVFGPNVFLDNPTESLPDGSLLSLNPLWFATPATAAKIASMLGGTVVESHDFTSAASPVQQQQPNELVQMPDGQQVNAGWIASLYTHGLPQSYIDQMIGEAIGQGATPA
jgi:biotin carboxyl carrier protein